MTDLFRSDNVVVRVVPAQDVSRWVVTFDNYGIGQGFDRQGFGEEFLRQSGVSAIHVMGRCGDWYQYPEMGEAMAAVRQATAEAGRIMTYGSSMGGYAALRFADAAGAHSVLAISPQYSIDPQKAAFEKRWLQDGQRIKWLSDIDSALTTKAKPVVIFDPMGDDRRHVELIETEIEISRIALPFCGHPATTFLADVSLLAEAVFLTLSGELIASDFRREARQRRGNSSIHHAALATLQPSSRQAWGLALARKALELAPTNPLAMIALADRLGRSGRHDEALALYEAATAASKRDATYLVAHADGLLAAGRLADAVLITEEVVGKLPNAAHLRSWQAFMLWTAGRRAQAVVAAEKAVMLHPSSEAYRSALEHYLGEVSAAAPPPVRWQDGPVRLIRALRRKLPGSIGSPARLGTD